MSETWTLTEEDLKGMYHKYYMVNFIRAYLSNHKLLTYEEYRERFKFILNKKEKE
jgi:hypothetical protein